MSVKSNGITHIPNLKKTKCLMCNKKAYLVRTRIFRFRNGWTCLRCKSWWTD